MEENWENVPMEILTMEVGLLEMPLSSFLKIITDIGEGWEYDWEYKEGRFEVIIEKRYSDKTERQVYRMKRYKKD